MKKIYMLQKLLKICSKHLNLAKNIKSCQDFDYFGYRD